MKHSIHEKLRNFLVSEEGRVGVKAPVALGIAAGSLLLAQTMLPTSADAEVTCRNNDDCAAGKVCKKWTEWEWFPEIEAWLLVSHSACK